MGRETSDQERPLLKSLVCLQTYNGKKQRTVDISISAKLKMKNEFKWFFISILVFYFQYEPFGILSILTFYYVMLIQFYSTCIVMFICFKLPHKVFKDDTTHYQQRLDIKLLTMFQKV